MPILDPQSTCTSLLNHLRSGEQSAWVRFGRIYTPLIEKWCRQQGIRRADDVEDIVQKVTLAVWQNIQEFGHGREENSFRAWLWTITRSKIVDLQRSANRTPNSLNEDLLANIPAPERLLESRNEADLANDRNILIHCALEVIKLDFSTKTWAAFWQTCALGRPPSEVGKEMGMTAAAVCMCRARVLRRLRETIDNN